MTLKNLLYRIKLFGLRSLYLSYGYSVHSPFAYKLLTQVISSPNVAFYAELLIPTQTFERLFYRLGANFPIKEVIVHPGLPQSFKTIASSITSFTPITPTEHMFDVFPIEERYTLMATTSKSLQKTELPRYTIALIFGHKNKAVAKACVARYGYGITITLQKSTLTILNPKLTPKHY